MASGGNRGNETERVCFQTRKELKEQNIITSNGLFSSKEYCRAILIKIISCASIPAKLNRFSVFHPGQFQEGIGESIDDDGAGINLGQLL